MSIFEKRYQTLESGEDIHPLLQYSSKNHIITTAYFYYFGKNMIVRNDVNATINIWKNQSFYK